MRVVACQIQIGSVVVVDQMVVVCGLLKRAVQQQRVN